MSHELEEFDPNAKFAVFRDISSMALTYGTKLIYMIVKSFPIEQITEYLKCNLNEINIGNNVNMTPLMVICYEDKPSDYKKAIVKLLLDHGADMYKKTGWTNLCPIIDQYITPREPFDSVLIQDDVDIAEIFLDYGFEINDIIKPISVGSINILNLLIKEKGIKLNNNIVNRLHYGVNCDNEEEMYKFLFDQGVNFDEIIDHPHHKYYFDTILYHYRSQVKFPMGDPYFKPSFQIIELFAKHTRCLHDLDFNNLKFMSVYTRRILDIFINYGMRVSPKNIAKLAKNEYYDFIQNNLYQQSIYNQILKQIPLHANKILYKPTSLRSKINLLKMNLDHKDVDSLEQLKDYGHVLEYLSIDNIHQLNDKIKYYLVD